MTGKTLARRIAIVVGALIVAVVVIVVALVLLVDSNVATKRAVDLVLPKVSTALGREVTLSGAKLHVFPNPRVQLSGITVAGRPGEPALVQADALEVEVGLWPLLRSLGKDVEVRAIDLVRPTVNLVRARDGTWNYEGIGGAKAGEAPAPREPTPAPAGGGARVAVDSIKVSRAAIRMVDRSAGGEDAGIALQDLDLQASGVGPGLPLQARIAAALASDSQNLSGQISIAKLPDAVPARPEDWPEVQGAITLTSLALDRIRPLLPGELGQVVRGGSARFDARLSTVEGHGYRVDGSGELKDVRLRGQAASGRFRATASWAPARPDAARVDVTELALRGPGVDLGGNVSLQTAPVRAWFVLTGPLLDLDAIMGVLPPSEAAKPAPKPAGGELLPAATRRQIASAAVQGTVAIGELRAGRVRATDVKARAALQGGTLLLDQLDASVFGGRVSAAGTRVSLAESVPTWNLAASLSGLDLAGAIQAFAGRSPLLGKLNGKLQISGSGTDWAKMRDGLTGLAALAVKDGTLTTADLGGDALESVTKGLEGLGRAGLAKKVGRVGGAKTTFKDLAGSFTVKDGFLAAQSPFKFGTDVGQASLGGRVGLDGRLDLQGGIAVPKQTLAQVVSGVPLPATLDVPLGLGGTLESPRVSVRGDEAAKALVKGEAKAATEEARKRLETEGRKSVEGLLKRFGK